MEVKVVGSKIQDLLKVWGEVLFSRHGINNVHQQILRAVVPLSNTNISPTVELSHQYSSYRGAGAALLQEQDAFAALGFRIGVMKGTTTSYAYQRSFNYADKTVFNAAAVSGFTENDCIQGFFSAGKVSIDSNGNPVTQPQLLSMFERPAQNQEGAAVVANSIGDGNFENFVSLNKQFIFSGAHDNKVKFSLGGPVTTIAGDSGVATEQNYLVVEMIGYLLHNLANEVNPVIAANKCVLS